jgi:hypothetical protein
MATVPRGFDVSAVLDDRVRRLQRDLEAVGEAVNAMPQALRVRLAGALGNEIARKLEAVEDDLSKPLRDHAIHPADAWARVHAKEVEVTALLEESLALVAGAALRNSLPAAPASQAPKGRERSSWDACSIADALLDELAARATAAGWPSFTVLGGAESFLYSSRLIQVRFPRPTVWDLPGTAHELGHYAARTMAEFRGGRMRNLADDLHLELGAADEASWPWLEELFADAFAAWVLGPAYALTCVTLAFDPLEASVGTMSHPPGSTRVRTITIALDALNDDRVRQLASEVAELWDRLVDVCEAGQLDEDDRAISESWPEKIVQLLAEHLPYGRFSTFTEAERVSSDLSAPGTDTTLADAINAAWLARIGARSSIGVGEVSHQAEIMAQDIAARRS